MSGESWNNEQIPAIIDRLWNVCGQMDVGSSIIDLRIWDKWK